MSTSLPTPSQRSYPQCHRDATRDLLVDEVNGKSVRALHRRPPRSLLVAAAAVIAMLGGTGVAAALGYLGSAPVTDTHSARCYSKVSHNFGNHFPGTTVAAVQRDAPVGASRGGVQAPVRMCGYMWSMGLVQGPHGAKTVPPLVGCVLPNGTAAVFPGGPDTCHRLGLAVAETK
jgi:hypothetical protein